jgi:hypothetical protein
MTESDCGAVQLRAQSPAAGNGIFGSVSV